MTVMSFFFHVYNILCSVVEHETVFFNSSDISKPNASSVLTEVCSYVAVVSFCCCNSFVINKSRIPALN